MPHTISVQTRGPGLYEFTREAQALVTGEGVLTCMVQHTSASLLIQENADPSVQVDLLGWLDRLAPPADDPSMAWLTHTLEGPDDMPAHIKAAVLPTTLQVPVIDGRLALGTWQGLYLVEHRTRAQTRTIVTILTRA